MLLTSFRSQNRTYSAMGEEDKPNQNQNECYKQDSQLEISRQPGTVGTDHKARNKDAHKTGNKHNFQPESSSLPSSMMISH